MYFIMHNKEFGTTGRALIVLRIIGKAKLVAIVLLLSKVGGRWKHPIS